MVSSEPTIGNGVKHIDERYYQIEAEEEIVSRLRAGGRGKLIAACGTGKTFISRRVAELLCPPGGAVVITCPSIALVAQTIREWTATSADFIALAVCSDESVTDSFYTVDDIDCPVTTCPRDIGTWLAEPTTKHIRLIVSTHMSAHRVGEALRRHNASAELLVVDEAHHTAGRVDKHAAAVHQDRDIPAHRRLYATATERIMTRATGIGVDGDVVRTVGMDDEQVFGPTLYRYPISRAISDRYLDDYRLVVIGVTKAEVLATLRRVRRDAAADGVSPALHMAAVHAGLARAARQFDLRRVLAFCPLVREAQEFARSFPLTLAALPHEAQPARPLYASCVHGEMDTAERAVHLGRLADPPRDGWTVIANARCLAEGVDLPTLDAVTFTHPKRSAIEIVQAVGRALRRDHSGSGVATILVPILLPDDPHDLTDDQVVPDDDYEVLWQVVRALRDHDEVFGANLDDYRAQGYCSDAPLQRTVVSLPDGYDTTGHVLQHLTVRIVRSATSNWWDGFAALLRFRDKYGHANPTKNYVDDNKVRLGGWADAARRDRTKPWMTSDRIEALQRVGFDFNPRESQWKNGLAAATAFHTEHGHLRIHKNLPPINGVNLYVWVKRRREDRKDGRLSAERIAALDAIGMVWAIDDWANGFAAAKAFKDEFGHLRPAKGAQRNGIDVGDWLHGQRKRLRSGKISVEQATALTELGIDWEPRVPMRTWDQALAVAAAYRAEHGHLQLPAQTGGKPTRYQGFGLYDWLVRQRRDYQAGKLTEKQVEQLAELRAIDP